MKRIEQVLLIVTFIPFCWLAMQVLHESGHTAAAFCTGGEVLKVALHPLIFSHTDLGENPHPLAVVWGGPLLGVIFPLLLWGFAQMFRIRGTFLLRFLAGFCLVANGVYIGLGWLIANGADPWVMTENGSPKWLLGLFGLITFPLGLYLWHNQGPHFGLGSGAGRVDRWVAISSVGLLVGLCVTEFIFNSR